MGRGDGSVKIMLETDIAAILSAYAAVGELWDLSMVLTRRRWRQADGETFQECLHRIEVVLGMVHRWLVRLRRHPLGLEIMRNDIVEEPTKEHSDSAE